MASPSKRKLEVLDTTPSDDPPCKTPKTFVKDKDHWLSDGNLLIQIGDTRFKIHKSRMIRESPWFKALIEQRAKGIPKETYEYQAEITAALNSIESYEGLDVFYLDLPGGPSCIQFRRLLTAMEGGMYVFIDSFRHVVGLTAGCTTVTMSLTNLDSVVWLISILLLGSSVHGVTSNTWNRFSRINSPTLWQLYKT